MLFNVTEARMNLEKLTEAITEAQKMITKVEINLKKMSFTSMMMSNLMHDLLDLAQLESSTFRINNEYFDLLQLI